MLRLALVLAALVASVSGCVPFIDGQRSPSVVGLFPGIIQVGLLDSAVVPSAKNASSVTLEVWAAGSMVWSNSTDASWLGMRYSGPKLPAASSIQVRTTFTMSDGSTAACKAATFLSGLDQAAVEDGCAGATNCSNSGHPAMAATLPRAQKQAGDLTFLRWECPVSSILPSGATIDSALAAITGKEMSTEHPAQILSTAALSVNGHWLGSGPGRGDAGWDAPDVSAPAWASPWRVYPVDAYNVAAHLSALSASDSVVLGAWGFGGPLFVQLWVRWSLADGSASGTFITGTTNISSDASGCQWSGADGDSYLNATWSKPLAGPFGQPRERPNSWLWPTGFDQQGFQPPAGGLAWISPQPISLDSAFSTSSTPLQTKRTRPVQFFGIGGGNGAPETPAAISTLTQGSVFVDVGRNIMGGLNVTVQVPAAMSSSPLQVRLRMSEELSAPQTLLLPMRTGNYYETVATIAPVSGTEAAATGIVEVRNLEFDVFRFATVELLWLPSLRSRAVSLPLALRLPSHFGTLPDAGAEPMVDAQLRLRCGINGGTIARVETALASALYDSSPVGLATALRGAGPQGQSAADSLLSSALRLGVSHLCSGLESCDISVREALHAGAGAWESAAMTVQETLNRIAEGHDAGVDAQATAICSKSQHSAVSSTAMPVGLVSVGVWRVQYPWTDGESAFTSSSEAFNTVFDLAAYTIRATSVDTFTDSNTRERCPYEADGLITARGRQALQTEWSWFRHGLEFVMSNPTWPTEWRQATPIMFHDLYMFAGPSQPAARFDNLLSNNTMRGYIYTPTGLVNYTGHPPRATRDIVDWPEDDRDGFVFSNITSVINAYAAVSLSTLAALRMANGDTTGSALAQSESLAIGSGMRALLWDDTIGSFCDGVCSEVSHSATHSAVFPLWAGIQPSYSPQGEHASADSWPPNSWRLMERIAGTGVDNMSVYGAWAWLVAAGGTGAGAGAAAGGQTAIGLAAADCGGGAEPNAPDTNGHCWRHMLASNATMTMEAWTRAEKPNLSWSHPWASSAVELAMRRVLGVTPIAPGAALLRVSPALGTTKWVTGAVPTMRGPVSVSVNISAPTANAVSWTLQTELPPATPTTLCAPLWYPGPPPLSQAPQLPTLTMSLKLGTAPAQNVTGFVAWEDATVCVSGILRPGSTGDGASITLSRQVPIE